MDPLFAASSLRIDVHGIPAIDGLSLRTTGERVVILGAPAALFEAAAGLRPSSRGELRVEGRIPIDAVRTGIVAGAPLDPPLPPRWTVAQYVTWSARLSGHPRTMAAHLASDAIARFALGPLARSKLGSLPLSARRATVLAAALATGATTILVEDPVTGLPAESAGMFARIAVRALDDRRTLFFGARLRLESPVALAADEAVVLFGSHVATQGAPAEVAAADRAFALQVAGEAQAFADAVNAAGGHVLGSIFGPAPARLSVELGPLDTRDLLRIADSSNAVVLELRPIALTLA